MPFFNFRKSSASAANAQGNAQPESMEVVRKRAKHRLIGSAVLVLIGVVGFPLLFDTQPRPIAVDMPIEIPGKNAVKPLAMAVKPGVVAAPPASPATVATTASLTPKEEVVPEKTVVPAPIAAVAPVLATPSAPKKEAKPELKTELKPEPKPEDRSEPKPEPKPVPKPVPKVDDGARARALLDGQKAAATTATGDERLVVQVGAFADADKATEVRQKLEKAGLKTYTQVAETKDGKRTRVRVGPFANKADAEKAASKIKALDLPAAVLTL